jgi:hypothetical protein
MGLLFSNEIKNQLEVEIRQSTNDIHIISAYCKKAAIKFIENCVVNPMQSKKLMVRFAYIDIISGASDLDVYDFCKKNGWYLYMRLDLHAKTYIFDKTRCIVGSANLTSRGINIVDNANYEIALVTSVSDEEMCRIDNLFEDAVLMTDDMYNLMKECFNKRNGIRQVSDDWDKKILSLFNPNIKVLFTYDFPNCNSLSCLKEDSLDFLGLSTGWTTATIKKAFVKCNVYRWLKFVLEEKPNKEIHYGELSSLIHNTIINDPKPYRKEVKELQSNLLNWIIDLDIQEMKIDRPNHSQRVRLVK